MAKKTHPPTRSNTATSLPSTDVTTLDAIVKALYESVSFPPGRQPDYQRLRMLFHPDGSIIPPKTQKNSELVVLDLDSFITRSREFVVTTGLERQGFHEKEVARRTAAFGSMVHILSTYESRHTVKDTTAFERGINSIQLVREVNRWYIVSILWEIERTGHPIPRAFLV